MNLPRRAFLGLRLAGEEGALVTGVSPGGMGAAAGIAAGDVLSEVGGRAVHTTDELVAAARAVGADERTRLVWRRGGEEMSREVALQRWPEERIEGHEVRYGQVGSPRLRTIVTVPDGAEAAPLVVFVQGIACESVDFGASADAAFALLVRGWAEAGFATARTEKRGVGDSEGGPCGESSFDDERGDHARALASFVREPGIDPENVFVFGHSVGGMIAPLLARETKLRGVMVYGTSSARWIECLAASTARQLRLRGIAEDEIVRRVARMRSEIATGSSFGRTAAFHRQLDAADLAAAWNRVGCDVLVLRGEHDWVVGADEQAAVAEAVEIARPGGATLCDLAGVDHALGRHASVEESVEAFGAGTFDRAVIEVSVAWMRARVLPSRG